MPLLATAPCTKRRSRSYGIVTVSVVAQSKAARVYAALLRDGWVLARQRGSHRLLRKDDRKLVFAHHDARELGRVQLAQLAREAGYTMDELKAIL